MLFETAEYTVNSRPATMQDKAYREHKAQCINSV